MKKPNIKPVRIDGILTSLKREETLPLPSPTKTSSNNHLFSDPLTGLLWQFMIISGVLIYGSHSILINLCKVDGKIPFNSAAVVLLIELAKLVFSLFFFIPEVLSGKAHLNLSIKTILAFSVPAVLYCINNNIVGYIQLFLDPASFQVMSNLKIASTAILYWLIIKRQISQQKWIALSLITLAGISNSYGGLHNHDEILPNQHRSQTKIYVSFFGVLLMFLYCVISGLAGVYTEYILKRQYQISLHLQNSLLYTYGIVFNFWAFLAQHIPSNLNHAHGNRTPVVSDFFSGFSFWTFLIVITQAMNGLIMSAVMKHSSNITRLIIIACAMIITTLLSVLLFSLQLNVYFILALILVVIALKFYHT